jgi:hypothetical protein
MSFTESVDLLMFTLHAVSVEIWLMVAPLLPMRSEKSASATGISRL